jgi:hypothetical protein
VCVRIVVYASVCGCLSQGGGAVWEGVRVYN